jgi:Zn-dependent M28 family amino/carboxypeptidase
VEFSPGGCDDGSGVVILLELFSNLVNDLTLTFSDVHLIVLFTNSEEKGLQGATAFITNHKWRHTIHRFINVDSASCNEVGSLVEIKPSQVFFFLNC